MYALIDRERMVVVHKHHDQRVISMLGHLEAAHRDTLNTFINESSGFGPLSEMDLRRIIKNTGFEPGNVPRSVLCAMLINLLNEMPESKVDLGALEAQCEWVTGLKDDVDPYRHVPKAIRPALVEEHDVADFPPAYKAAEDCVQRAASARNLPAATTPAPGDAERAAERPSATVGHSIVEDFTPPRPGSSTYTIFAWCATAWKESNYADDKKTLDTIRAKALDALTGQGLNASTVRTQAMRWYQHRQRFVI
jgi:hypothetical protein